MQHFGMYSHSSPCNILACTLVNPPKVAKLPVTLTLVEYVNGKIETTVRYYLVWSEGGKSCQNLTNMIESSKQH